MPFEIKLYNNAEDVWIDNVSLIKCDASGAPVSGATELFANGGFDGFAILTQEADAQMSPYHNRMPVILDNEALKKLWLYAPPQMPFAEIRRQFETPRISAEAV